MNKINKIKYNKKLTIFDRLFLFNIIRKYTYYFFGGDKFVDSMSEYMTEDEQLRHLVRSSLFRLFSQKEEELYKELIGENISRRKSIIEQAHRANESYKSGNVMTSKELREESKKW